MHLFSGRCQRRPKADSDRYESKKKTGQGRVEQRRRTGAGHRLVHARTHAHMHTRPSQQTQKKREVDDERNTKITQQGQAAAARKLRTRPERVAVLFTAAAKERFIALWAARPGEATTRVRLVAAAFLCCHSRSDPVRVFLYIYDGFFFLVIYVHF